MIEAPHTGAKVRYNVHIRVKTDFLNIIFRFTKLQFALLNEWPMLLDVFRTLTYN